MVRRQPISWSLPKITGNARAPRRKDITPDAVVVRRTERAEQTAAREAAEKLFTKPDRPRKKIGKGLKAHKLPAKKTAEQEVLDSIKGIIGSARVLRERHGEHVAGVVKAAGLADELVAALEILDQIAADASW